MPIQKVNYSVGSKKQVFLGNNANNSQNKENKDYNILKESAMEGLLLSGMAFANKDFIEDMCINSTKASKSNPIKDKILFGTLAACFLITTVQLIKAIKHYIDDKKNGLV